MQYQPRIVIQRPAFEKSFNYRLIARLAILTNGRMPLAISFATILKHETTPIGPMRTPERRNSIMTRTATFLIE